MKRRSWREWIGILADIAGVLGFIGSIIAFLISLRSCGEIRKTQEEIRSLSTCADVGISIKRPGSGQNVLEQLTAIGRADVHPTCRFVYLVVRSAPRQGRAQYRITDSVQVEIDGQWRGSLSFKDVLPGESADVEALLTAEPDTYAAGDVFALPPDRGGRSNTVHVTRIGG